MSDDTIPYYFLVMDDYVLGTPRGIPVTDKTISMPFNDLADNVDLQEELKLLSAVLARPLVSYAEPSTGEEFREEVARFISCFTTSEKEKEKNRLYMQNNGLVSILVLNEKLMDAMPKVIALKPVVKQIDNIITAEYDFGNRPLAHDECNISNGRVRPVYLALFKQLETLGYMQDTIPQVPMKIYGSLNSDPEHITFRITAELSKDKPN